MYRNHSSNRPINGFLNHQFTKLENSLGIEHTDFIWDKKDKQLLLIMETNQLIGREVKAIVKGDRLILEAPLLDTYTKPFRTHLPGEVSREEFEEGLTIIGFSEIKLKSGYHYQVHSCQTIDMRLIKVILDYSIWGINGKHLA